MRYKLLTFICLLAAGCCGKNKAVKTAPISKENAIAVANQYVKERKLEDKVLLSEVKRQEQLYCYLLLVTKISNQKYDYVGAKVKTNGDIALDEELWGDSVNSKLSEYPRQSINSESEAERYLLKALKQYSSELNYRIEYRETFPSGWRVKFRLKGFVGNGGWFEVLVSDDGQVAKIIGGK